MQLSEEGRALLRELEGCEREPYQDAAGLWTCGVGHCLTKDELSSGKIVCGDTTIRWKDGPLTDEEIDRLLSEDASWSEACIEACIRVQLTQNQYDALVIFAYNIGSHAFRESTLCRLLNQGDYAAVPEQMRRWTRAGGRVVEGLKRRREREIQLWNDEGT